MKASTRWLSERIECDIRGPKCAGHVEPNKPSGYDEETGETYCIPCCRTTTTAMAPPAQPARERVADEKRARAAWFERKAGGANG